jgi:hypothetical protein
MSSGVAIRVVSGLSSGMSFGAVICVVIRVIRLFYHLVLSSELSSGLFPSVSI